MKKFDFYTQIACSIAVIISLIVYFVCYKPYLFNRRHIALSDIRRSCTSHESAAIKATNDFNKRNLCILISGLPEFDEEEEKELMEMEKNYGVTYLSCGCLGCGKYTNTYDQVMKHLINEKYKKKIFKTIDVYSLKAKK